MTNNGANHVRITDDNHGPLLAMITWFFMVMMILSAIFRSAIKYFIRRRLELDDYVLWAALVFGVVHSIIISLSIRDGLGQREDNLNSDNLMSIQKTLYAADLLFILACGLAKVSILLLLRRLVVHRDQTRIATATVYIALAWTLSSMLGAALQCELPNPWAMREGHCKNEFVFWVAIAPVDIITEIIVMVLPVLLVLPLQLASSKKTAVVLAFAFRICVVLLIIIRLALLHTYYDTPDFVFELVPSACATQILISVSITTACVPALKPFLDSFDSGMLNVELKRNRGLGGSHSYELQSKGQTNFRASRLAGDDSDGKKFMTSITASRGRKGSVRSGDSDEMIIKRTHQWTVQYDTAEPATSSAPSSLANGQ